MCIGHIAVFVSLNFINPDNLFNPIHINLLQWVVPPCIFFRARQRSMLAWSEINNDCPCVREHSPTRTAWMNPDARESRPFYFVTQGTATHVSIAGWWQVHFEQGQPAEGALTFLCMKCDPDNTGQQVYKNVKATSKIIFRQTFLAIVSLFLVDWCDNGAINIHKISGAKN